MKYMRLIPCIALLLLVTPATNVKAQIRDPILSTRTAITTAPDTTILALTHRIEALESTIAQLQQKLAFIKSVNPLVLDPGADVTIKGGRVSLEAQNSLDVKAGSNSTIQSWGNLIVESKGMLDLKGMQVRHNAGTMPVACTPPYAGGGNALPGPCSLNVLVPPPFQ